MRISTVSFRISGFLKSRKEGIAFTGATATCQNDKEKYFGVRKRTGAGMQAGTRHRDTTVPRRFEDMLARIARDGDHQAFVELFRYFAPRVKSYLMKAGLSEPVADDLAQDVMLTVWRKASSFNPALSAASTWIFTIARNKRTDFFRKTACPEFDTPEAVSVPDSAESPAEAHARIEESRALAGAIKALPPEQADILSKAFFDNKTHQEIADEERIPLGTVKSRIRIALEKLRKQHQVSELWK